jgi:flagellar hook protein FlgE
MIDSVYIAMTGLQGYERGLRVIANNTANLNTPGFKGSTLQFSDLFYSTGTLSGGSGGQSYGQYGHGLNTLGTTLNAKQGELQSTNNDLDLALDGVGFFTVRDSAGKDHYTRAGQLKFNTDGVLVANTNGNKVIGIDANGALGQISISDLKSNAAKASSLIKFGGNLSSTALTATVGSMSVIDNAGTSKLLSAKFTPVTGKAGSWSVEVLDGTTSVGTGQISFVNGQPNPAESKIDILYTPAGQAALPLSLDFSTNLTSYDSGSVSSIAVASIDGHGPGSLTKTTFDSSGVLQLTYSNQQTVTGPRLSLGRFTSQDALEPIGDNFFDVKDARAWQVGVAGDAGFGKITAGKVEISNVDLSQEFSNLVIMQRGYQASSQVISTANEMIAELFSMKSGK